MSEPRSCLDARGELRREALGAAVVDRAERDAVVVGGDERVAQREDLEAARVGEDRAVPGHERVQAAELGDHVLARPEVQVVRVAEDDRRAERAQLVGVDGLDRRLRADGHERGRRARRRARCGARRRAPGRRSRRASKTLVTRPRTSRGCARRARCRAAGSAARRSSCSRMRASSAASASRERAAAEQRGDPRQVRLVLVEERGELPLAAVAPEVPPLVGASRLHRISIASPKE